MKKIPIGGRTKQMLRHNADAITYWNTLEPEQQHDYFEISKLTHGTSAKALTLAVLDAWEESPDYNESRKGELVMSTLNAENILETIAELDVVTNGEVVESELIALHRLTSQVEVDQMLQHMGWDSQAQFESDMDEAETPLLTGDGGPYVGWYVESDETGDPPAMEDMEEETVDPIFLISDEGHVARASMSGWQDPDDANVVYVTREEFDVLPGQPTDEIGEAKNDEE